MIRMAICMVYRSGSEVLLHDSGPLLSVHDALSAFEAIADALDGNANQITMGGGQLVVRIASRSFEPLAGVGKPAPRPKRIPPPGEF
jgi:hypothetical protein